MFKKRTKVLLLCQFDMWDFVRTIRNVAGDPWSELMECVF